MTSDNGGKQAHLLGLPDELILLIFDHVSISNEVLYVLSQVSRRLNDLCLSICFARFGIKNPRKQAKVAITDNPLQIDGLSALRISLNVVSLERLVCKFPPCKNEMPAMFRCVDRAARFIRRLQSVNKVILVFSNDACSCCSKNNSKLRVESAIMQEWSSVMGELMNIILERGCRNIVLKGGRYLGHVFAFRRTRTTQNKLPNPIEAVKTFFTGTKSGEGIEDINRPPRVIKGENWEFKKAESHKVPLVLTNVSPVARDTTNLRSLSIQSMMFLMPPLLQWTISALHFSKLETLTLGSLSINHKCWPALFELIENASPNLKELTICKIRQIDAGDLLKFLSRFPNLTSLTLNHDVESYDAYSIGPFPDFPKLISLHAPASWVHKLLSAQQRGLECLESLSITYKLRNDGLSHWFRQHPTPSIPSLLSDQLRPLTLCLEVRLGDSPAWKMFEDLNAEQASNQRVCLDLISGITLLVEEEFVKGDMPLMTVLPRWLALFPALRFLTITGHNTTIDGMDMLEAMIDIVKAKKLQLQNLDVNGKEAEFVRNKKSSSP